MFGDLSIGASFAQIEEEMRRFWRRYGVPSAARTTRQPGLSSVIYQQPLLVAGQPWFDQVRMLAVADLLTRYRAMRGDTVQHRTGWVSHGLPVEVAVERMLGPDVVDYDLARFSAACREVAAEGKREGEMLAQWLGVWLDPDTTYDTATSFAIGTVWAVLRRLWDAGWLRHECRLVPVCPRCATPLSGAEASRRAAEAESSSVWMRLPWDDKPNTYLLAWTAAPWTLVGMVALAVHPQASYALVETASRRDQPPVRLLLAEAALGRAPLGQYRVVRRVEGRSLREARYRPPFTFLPILEGTGRVVLSEEVPLDPGTGLLPLTPAFDSLSLALAQTLGLPVPDLLDDRGKLNDAVTPWRGLSPLESEPFLVEDLQARGLLVRAESGRQTRTVCPYCETPLLPQARDVWLVDTASGPWTVSRDRAWGVPLPIWACGDCGEQLCVAGLDDLAHRTGLNAGELDPHRPAVDGLTFPCTSCGGTMRRVSAVVDAAFEAALVPWAIASQTDPAEWHLDPFDPGKDQVAQRTLAVGLGDKHLGWLGDLTETAAMLRGSLAWEQAVALPESEAEPFPDLERDTPADALRWAAYADTTPARAQRDFLQPLARLAMLVQFESASMEREGQAGDGSELLDRWLSARLQQTIFLVGNALDDCEPSRAAAELSNLVADLTGWYAMHRPGGGTSILPVLSRLLAPFVPHLAEAIHRRPGARSAESVHLSDWPIPDPSPADGELLAGMALVRRLETIGRAARSQAGIEPGRRLPRALVSSASEAIDLARFGVLLAEALGVGHVEMNQEATAKVTWRLALERERTVERGINPAQIDTALANLPPQATALLVSQLWEGLSVGLELSGRAVTLLPDEVRVTVQAPAGWAAAVETGCLVVLELD